MEKRVFKNLQLFMDNKEPGDDLFDRLDVSFVYVSHILSHTLYHCCYCLWTICYIGLQTASLNEHLRSLMDGLTVKVFRTYNASITLQQQLAKLTRGES